jgi:putative ABC transport system ATP-binding protein
MNKLITVKELSKTLGKVKAVNNLSFSIKSGELVAIQGHSGSGKSTLLSLLSGLEKQDEGEILFDNKKIGNMGEDDLALFRRKNVGIVFQSFNLIPTLNVVENIALPLFPTNINKKEMMTKAQKSAESVGLDNRLDHYPNELSGGEQQRVAIARALINNPKVLFADEPTGNLDSKTGKNILELLQSLNKEKGLTVVMVTHDDSIAKVCDRIIQLKDGGIHDE